mgnify:CR=1 FL=1
MTAILKTENLGKQYRIARHRSQSAHSYVALRDELTQMVRTGFGLWGKKQPKTEPFWALQNISLRIEPGQRVGIIGRNGAGKSTLLKLISRITAPTTGSIRLRGRVSSLLEVGTGFHPELTGRENIFLNGAVLGMSRAEIRYKFDEIVDFAEVETFLDTPVKRYSSGMRVRLAFAVAAHLEPEILVVDEVLAVGDLRFQKKCLGKMEQVGGEGRTVLIVSHNMGIIDRLCNRGIVLDKGEMALDASATDAVAAYHAMGGSCAGEILRLSDNPAHPVITGVRFMGEKQDSPVQCGSPMNVLLNYEVQSSQHLSAGLPHLQVSMSIKSASGELKTACCSMQQPHFGPAPAKGTLCCHVDKSPIMPGEYTVQINLNHNGQACSRLVNHPLHVHGGDYFGYGTEPVEHRDGIYMAHRWELYDSLTDKKRETKA